MGSTDKIYDNDFINPINYENNYEDSSNDSVLKHLSVSDFLKANNKFEPIKNRGSFDNTISKDPLFLSAKDFQNNLFLTEILGLNTYITNIESQKDIDNFENLLKNALDAMEGRGSLVVDMTDGAKQIIIDVIKEIRTLRADNNIMPNKSIKLLKK